MFSQASNKKEPSRRRYTCSEFQKHLQTFQTFQGLSTSEGRFACTYAVRTTHSIETSCPVLDRTILVACSYGTKLLITVSLLKQVSPRGACCFSRTSSFGSRRDFTQQRMALVSDAFSKMTSNSSTPHSRSFPSCASCVYGIDCVYG